MKPSTLYSPPFLTILMPRSPRGQSRRGYVLVVTLGLLVLAASLMVAVGRGAMRHASEARLTADELQHRWGVISCRSAILPYSESILLTSEVAKKAATPSYHESIQLGLERFEINVADELAKANVNQLLDHTDRPTAETRLRQGLSGSGSSVNVHLRPSGTPLTGPTSAPSTAPATQPAHGELALWISGFGQIFDDASPERMLEMQGGVRVADLLTCWGGGRINIRRISPEALRLIAGGTLTAIDQSRLLQMRDLLLQGKPLPTPRGAKVAPDPISRLIQAAGVDTKALDKLPQLTTQSTCHSLWIVSRDSRRVHFNFFILDQTDEDHPRSAAFVW